MPNNNSRAASRWAFIAAVMAAVLLPQAVAAQTGSISGRVVDAQSAQPLISAQVFVADGQGTLTNLDGAYILRNLPVGTYDLQVQLIGYALKTVTGVSVSAGQVVTVDITMASSAIDLEGITVSAAAERGSTTSLLLERARSVVVQDAIPRSHCVFRVCAHTRLPR